MPTIGILAYGSLIEEPGAEIEAARLHVVPDVLTPFHVEFARKSRTRGDGPSLVPVADGGAPLAAQIIALREGVTEAEAADMNWRRETRKAGSYVASKNPGLNVVVVKRVEQLGGVDVVLYTHIGANIKPLTPGELARLAIASVAKAELGKDGISYLMAALARGTRTALSPAYQQEILRSTGAGTLAEALAKLQAGRT